MMLKYFTIEMNNYLNTIIIVSTKGLTRALLVIVFLFLGEEDQKTNKDLHEICNNC